MMLTDYLETIRKHQDKAPVQTVPIARDLGLKVYRSSGWSKNLSGLIRKDKKYGGESGFAIFVNANHPEHRRRFTIAHEIAHFVLHGRIIGDGIRDDALYRSGLSNRVEAQANRLAADILMPRHLLDPLLVGKDVDVETLARTFNVSKSAMSIRIGVPA